MTARKLQRKLYLAQRTLGDVNAIQRGTIVKRLVRRSVTRNLFRLFR